MCHAIVELRYRGDLPNDSATTMRATSEEHLNEIVEQCKQNEFVIRIRVYRPNERWERIEQWMET